VAAIQRYLREYPNPNETKRSNSTTLVLRTGRTIILHGVALLVIGLGD
jgi:hypothetical protein